ncbi:SDR family oxidoreductase [Acidithiobacillus sp. AMEEHan]|uniref:SDR family oxidoreductase n=1 Tax=Acidithiobacillus sp. AMEEHan TaxID=2994951 RepID=UPI0027E4B97A|nr:SDR family oxidoreductase [Acidithiobacillus sp. AMEEHan]
MNPFSASRRPAGAIVITGAGSGIGAALARCYARPGQSFLLLGRRQASLAQVASELRQQGADVELATVDVRDPEALARIAADFAKRHGPIALLIANAGISVGSSCELAEDCAIFADVIGTNLLGMHYSIAAFLPYLPAQAQVVGIGSVAGFRGLPGAAAYAASKAAVAVYLESLRLDLRARRISVTCIAPGFIDTPMTADNPYPMPWLMDVQRAARKMRRSIDRRRRLVVMPWQMACLSLALRIMPSFLYERLWPQRLASKPRRSDSFSTKKE